MTKSTEEIIKNIAEIKYNIPAMIGSSIGLIEEAFDLKDGMIDTSSPIISLLSISAMHTGAFMLENLRTTRKVYPALATNMEELYPHMCDKDHLGLFAAPVTEKIQRVVSLDSLKSAMIDNPITGNKEVRIPAGSKIVFGNMNFCSLYGVTIAQMPHGSITLTYDVGKQHPLFPMTTNTIIPKVITSSTTQTKFIVFDTYVTQVDVVAVTTNVNSATGFKRAYGFNDNFCLARVFYKNNGSNGWKEITTTHTDAVYDRTKVTALLKVIDKTLSVTIPQIYFTEGMISGSVKVEYYLTKGSVHLNATGFGKDDFVEESLTTLEEGFTPYVNAWKKIDARIISAPSIISGGANPVDFYTARERVINNSIAPQTTPLNTAQLKTAISRDGFNIVTKVDTPTRRLLLATKEMPATNNPLLLTPIAANIEKIVTTFNTLKGHALTHTRDRCMVIPPEVLYETVNGVVNVVPMASVQALLSMDKDSIAKEVSRRDFSFSPFHYVLDASADVFSVRPYYLSAPKAQSGLYIEQNNQLNMTTLTIGHDIEKTPTGYRLSIVVTGNAVWMELDDSHLACHLSYATPDGVRAFIAGVMQTRLSNGDVVFAFDFTTDCIANVNDWLTISNAYFQDANPRAMQAALSQVFDVYHIYTGPQNTNWSHGTIDAQAPSFLLPARYITISHEQVDVTFGYALKHLWAPTTTIRGGQEYQKHTHDVPMLYQEDVYEVNPETNTILFPDGNGGFKLGKKLHSVGEQCTNEDGELVWSARAGDVVLDQNNQPVVAGENEVARIFSMFMLEGAYYFTNNITASNYLQEVVLACVDWITDRMATMAPDTLEQTKVYFAPRHTRGSFNAYTDSGSITNVNGCLRFNIRVSVTESLMNNLALQQEIKESCIKALYEQTRNATISRDGCYSALRKAFGDDVVTFTITGFWDNGYEAMSVENDNDRFSLAKELIALPDGDLLVAEAVDVKFELFKGVIND